MNLVPNEAQALAAPRRSLLFIAFFVLLIAVLGPISQQAFAAHWASAEPIRFNDDGGWCWFEDPRVLLVGNKLLIGSVAAGRFDPDRRGDIEVTVYDLESAKSKRIELFDQLQLDDHDSPVFISLPDERVLSLFSRHGNDACVYVTESRPPDLDEWSEPQRFCPSDTSRITYSNLFLLREEDNRLYDFYRGLDDSFKPSFSFSDDLGRTWKTGNVYIDVPSEQRHRPYVRYASDGGSTIHFVFTEGHPRVYDNSIYHMQYSGGLLRTSDGKPIRPLLEGLARPQEGTLVFQGGPDRVAWTVDMELDELGHPMIVYSVQMDSAEAKPGSGGEDHRFRYAQWDGTQWIDSPLAYAGRRLYAGEDDYTGLAALYPRQPGRIYISTDAHPETGAPLISSADGKRHHEIFEGRQEKQAGGAWKWTALTVNSTADNLRPIVPTPHGGKTFLLWLRGEYRSYTDYSQEIVGIPLD